MARIQSGTAGGAVEVYEVPERLSYTQLTMLHPHYPYACARKWGYGYRLKLPRKPSTALLVGRAFDEAANGYFTMRMQGVDATEAATTSLNAGLRQLDEQLREAIPDIYGNPEPAQQWVDDCVSDYQGVLTAGFAAFLRSEGERQVAAVQSKHEFTLKLSETALMGVIGYSDRVDEDGTLVDHKFSGSARWNKDDVWDEDWVSERRDQLLMYWLARNAEERRRGEALTPPLNGKGRLVVTYHKLGLNKPQVRVCEVELSLATGGKMVLERLAWAARTAQESRYPARPGKACGFCDFVTRCREDEAARGRPFFELIDIPF